MKKTILAPTAASPKPYAATGNASSFANVLRERTQFPLLSKLPHTPFASSRTLVGGDGTPASSASESSGGSVLSSENVHLRLDTLEYFIFRFVYAARLDCHAKSSAACVEVYIKLLQEYLLFFMAPSANATAFSLRSPGVPFELVHVKDFAKFCTRINTFFVGVVEQLWIGGGCGISQEEGLLPGATRILCIQSFADYVTDHAHFNAYKQLAVNECKRSLFLFLMSAFRTTNADPLAASLPIDAVSSLVITWILFMHAIAKMSPSGLRIEADFAFFHAVLHEVFRWLCTRSALSTGMHPDHMKAEMRTVLLPILNFFVSDGVCAKLAAFEKILVDGNANCFSATGFSHEKFQALSMGIKAYDAQRFSSSNSVPLFFNAAAAASNETRAPSRYPRILAAFVRRAADSVALSSTKKPLFATGDKEDFAKAASKALALLGTMFAFDAENVDADAVIGDFSCSISDLCSSFAHSDASAAAAAASQTRKASASRRFNAVTADEIAELSAAASSTKNGSTVCQSRNEVAAAVILLAAVAALLNVATRVTIAAVKRTFGVRIAWADRLPPWNLRRFAAMQWLLTLPVVSAVVWWVVFHASFSVKVCFLAVTALLCIVHRLFFFNKIILI